MNLQKKRSTKKIYNPNTSTQIKSLEYKMLYYNKIVIIKNSICFLVLDLIRQVYSIIYNILLIYFNN